MHAILSIVWTMFTFIGFMFVFPGCTKRPTKAAVLEEKIPAEKQAVHSVGNVKHMASEKEAGAAKPYLAPKEANLPVDRNPMHIAKEGTTGFRVPSFF